MGVDVEAGQSSNKGKHLMIFNDRSGSMSGTPWNAVQEAERSFTDILYPNNEAAFETIHLAYFGNTLDARKHPTRQSYINHVNTVQFGGGTSF